ncbi:MAG: YaaW family protein [Elainellaceae cyanobacterium]
MDELRTGLELASDEELRALASMLFARRFNPIDYAVVPTPLDIHILDRPQQIERIDQRFRFLAADGLTVLRGQSCQISYRQVLLTVCRNLSLTDVLAHAGRLSTEDLEAEIFLHFLHRTWKRLPQKEQEQLALRVQQSVSRSPLHKDLPASMRQDPLRTLLVGSGAIAVSSMLRGWLLQQVARQFAWHMATYQVTQKALAAGGTLIASQIKQRAALQMARRGMAISATRYTAVRTVFSVLGPAMWAWFLTDLGWRAIATNYSRIIPVIFTLAQIRLTREGMAAEAMGGAAGSALV